MFPEMLSITMMSHNSQLPVNFPLHLRDSVTRVTLSLPEGFEMRVLRMRVLATLETIDDVTVEFFGEDENRLLEMTSQVHIHTYMQKNLIHNIFLCLLYTLVQRVQHRK